MLRRARPAGAGQPRPQPLPRRLILFLFVLSGVSGLVYQVIWARQLTLVFGATSPAITTVLASFMLGLALGSYGAGRWAGRWGNPLRAYAVIELGIGAYAVAFPFLLDALALVHIPLFRLLVDAPLALGGARVVLVVGLLLAPTALMGASLPVLARALIQEPTSMGREAGLLYGLNTLGAAAGVYLATFFLIPGVGLTGGWAVAAALNWIVGGIAWRCAAGWRGPAAAPPVPAAAGPGAGWVLAAYGCSGLAALGYEVVWTRLLVLLFGSSVYAFAVMLTSFLLGLGLGGLLGGRLAARRRDPFLLTAALQVVIAVTVLTGAPWFDRLPPLFLAAFRVTGGEWWSLTTLEFLMALGLMILPTTAMGATFPLVARLLGGETPAERVVGNAYAVNTWGAILGAVVTGFGLIPWLGFRGSLVALAGFNTLAACLLLARAPGTGVARWGLPVPAAALLAVVAVLPGWNPKSLSSGVYLYADQYGGGRFERVLEQQRVLFYREGATATVAVIEGRYRFLRVNGKTDAGDSPDNLTQRLLAHVPLLLHPAPRSVLVVGLGTGITLGTALLYPIEQADAVEISPEVVDASRFFTEASGRALEDPRARLYVLDARTWLQATDRRYDVIISEPSNPWQTGNATLFTLDHYRLTKRRLAPSGVVCQWLPYYRMEEADFKAAIRTFQAVFPHTTLWLSGGDVLLVGGADPLAVDPARFLARASTDGVARNLREIGIADGRALLGLLALDPERVRRYAGEGSPLHTDNFPLLEFSAPKTLYRESAPQILAALRDLAAHSALPLARSDGTDLAALYEGVAQQRLLLRMPQAALVALEHAAKSGGASAGLRRLQAVAWNEVGVMRFRQGDRHGAQAAFERAVGLAPETPETYLNLGVLASEGFGDLKSAERAVSEALRLRPGYRDALVALARILERQGRWSGAEAAWRQVLMADPDDPEARQGLEAVWRARPR